MSTTDDGDFEEAVSDGESQQRTKRRRLTDTSSGSIDALSSQDDTMEDESNHEATRKDNKKAEKPKSKYRIHIPKNPQLPQDSFFTQLPNRPSSPYRIETFYWKKPGSPSPPKGLQAPARTTANSDPKIYARSITNPATIAPAKSVGNEKSLQKVNQTKPSDDEFSDHDLDDIEAADIPDAIFIDSQTDEGLQNPQHQHLRAPLSNLRQTTLFGAQALNTETQHMTQKRNWPLANKQEPASHHKLDNEALQTWIYPTNLGTIRDYQFNIVVKALYHNMLVALPTGLGKTFIAATVMLNWFRWAPQAQIVFVAPTRPLVTQQVKACFEVAGIPRSDTIILTGITTPGVRAEEWQSKRVFFMTPQTLANDLKTGICDPKRLVLLVIDEAHRATGSYAYVEVVKFVKRFNSSFRVLALTATPGSSVETVQEVIDGLGIARIEIRTEESFDIRQYVHARKIETVIFDNSEEMIMLMDLFSEALQPLVNKLTGMNAYWSKDPMGLTPYGCTQARQRWNSSDASKNFALKGIVNSIFSLLASLSHASELLKFHGIGPFYHKLLAFRDDVEARGKDSKYHKQVRSSAPFTKMMSRVQAWINDANFIGHPKLEYLQQVILNHFLDAGEGRGAADPSSTKTMIFAHYRDSAEEIARVLERNSPMIRPHVFVGQAKSKGSEGMDQKKQLGILEKFKAGTYNTLVATSIGEEGLDIGEVDLIVCYDASASPIRMLQRMGRTGRKRTGNIVVTLMRGKEENNFMKAKDNYEKMQAEIASGARFNYHDEDSRRIVPIGIQPVVDKRVIDIPPENTQGDAPEPKKRGRPPKRPPKKFYMPDGVETGFKKASRIDRYTSDDSNESDEERWELAHELKAPPVQIPPLNQVLLTPDEERTFEKNYLDIGGDEPQTIDAPKVDAFPRLQKLPRPTKHISHGAVTLRTIASLEAMGRAKSQPFDIYERHLLREDLDAAVAQKNQRARFTENVVGATVDDQNQSTQETDDTQESFEDASHHTAPNRTGIGSSEDAEHEIRCHSLLEDDANARVPSSASSPPPGIGDLESRRDFDSGDEFPELEILAGRHGRCEEKEAIPSTKIKDRRVVLDSSQDE